MLAANHDIDGIVNRVDVIDEPKVLKGGFDAKCGTEVQKFGVVLCAEFPIGCTRWWTCDGEFSADGCGLFQSSADFVEGLSMLWAGGLEPTGQIDGCGDDKSVIVECHAKFSECSAGLEMQIDMVVPQFDRIVSGLARDLDLAKHGSSADGAGIQAVTKA
jgi:hypothetical protein